MNRRVELKQYYSVAEGAEQFFEYHKAISTCSKQSPYKPPSFLTHILRVVGTNWGCMHGWLLGGCFSTIKTACCNIVFVWTIKTAGNPLTNHTAF